MSNNYLNRKPTGLVKWFLSLLLLFTSSTVVNAEAVDYGELELGKEYSIPMFGDVSGYYTATEDGVIKLTSTCGDFPAPWSDEAHTTPMSYTVTINENVRTFDLSLSKGQTVYFFRSFCMSEGTFTLTKEDGLSLSEVTPADGSTMSYGGDPSVTFRFSTNVKIGGAQIVIGDYTQDVTANVSGSTVHITPKNDLKALFDEGILQKGTEFTFRLTNVRMSSDESQLFGSDGTCEVSYISASKPIELVSVGGLLSQDNSKFLSYWPKGDARGFLTMTFSGELQQPEEGSNLQVAVLGFGNAEGEVGDYYTESVPYTVSGNTLSCDFTGKLRTPENMVVTGNNYGRMRVRILNVTDTEGNLAYADNSGSLGSYTYILSYEEVKADITTEFTPANGDDLNSDEIEIWTTDYNKISFDGIIFTYTENGETKSVVTTDYETTADADVQGAYIIKVKVPAKVQGKKNIIVSLSNLIVADGQDHSADFTAKYNAFVLKKATYKAPADEAVAVPLSGAEIANFEAGGTLSVTTNMDSKVGYATYQVVDLDAADPANAIVMTLASLRHPNGDDGQPDLSLPLEAEIYGGITKFYQKHTYRIDVTAYAKESDYTYHNDPLGVDSIKFKGATEAFTFSDIQFVSADPENKSTISSEADAVITLTWDGMVALNSATSFVNYGQGVTYPITSIEAINEDDGYSNQWKLTISQSILSMLGETLDLSIVATDLDGKIVEGNEGTEENSYLALSYNLSNASAKANIAISPADGEEVEKLYQFTVSTLNGQGINESYKGDVIKVYSVAGHGTEVATVTSVDLVIPADKMDDYSYTPTAVTLTLDKEVTEPGSYYIEIPAGYFILGEQFSTEYSSALTAYYIVKGANGDINFTTAPENGSTVSELSTIYITFDDQSEIGIGSGKLSYTKDGSEAIAMNDAIPNPEVLNGAIITFDSPLVEEGTYVINVPEGYFLDANGDPLPAFTLTYTIGGESSVNVTANPANMSTVDELSTISLVFNDYDEIGVGSGKLTYTKDGGEAVAMSDAIPNQYVLNGADIYFDSPLTEEGTYVIYVPEGYFLDENGDPLPAFTLTYVVSGPDGVTGIGFGDSTKQTVYSLSGVRLTTPLKQLPAGVYIVNGKKVILK